MVSVAFFIYLHLLQAVTLLGLAVVRPLGKIVPFLNVLTLNSNCTIARFVKLEEAIASFRLL